MVGRAVLAAITGREPGTSILLIHSNNLVEISGWNPTYLLRNTEITSMEYGLPDEDSREEVYAPASGDGSFS